MKNKHPRHSAARPAWQLETHYLTTPIVLTRSTLCQGLRRRRREISEPHRGILAARLKYNELHGLGSTSTRNADFGNSCAAKCLEPASGPQVSTVVEGAENVTSRPPTHRPPK